MHMLCDEGWGQTAVATFPRPCPACLVTLAPAWRDQIQHFLLLPGGQIVHFGLSPSVVHADASIKLLNCSDSPYSGLHIPSQNLKSRVPYRREI